MYQYLYLLPLIIDGYAFFKNIQILSTIAFLLCVFLCVWMGSYVMLNDHGYYTDLYDVNLNKGSLYMGYVIMMIGLMINRYVMKSEVINNRNKKVSMNSSI